MDRHCGEARLDKAGTEAVGGVVVVRYGANPLAVIQRVKERVEEIEAGLPRKTLDDGTISQVRVVPFYDRTGLIQETLGTLNDALRDEILVTILVVLLMIAHLRSAGLISGLLPLSVLMCFIAMKQFGVDANVVALSGIAIAIGTMVDMGVVICESILGKIRPNDTAKERKDAIQAGASEVGSAVLTAVLTTVVSFLPVFTMEGAEGKLFRPVGVHQDVCTIGIDRRRARDHSAGRSPPVSGWARQDGWARARRDRPRRSPCSSGGSLPGGRQLSLRPCSPGEKCSVACRTVWQPPCVGA